MVRKTLSSKALQFWALALLLCFSLQFCEAFTVPVEAKAVSSSPSSSVIPTAPYDISMLPNGSNTSDAVALTPSGRKAVLDDESYLTEAQQVAISKKLAAMGSKYQMDIVIAFNNKDSGRTAMENADDTMAYNGYSTDAVLMLIDFSNSKLWLSTRGRAIKLITKKQAENITGAAVKNNRLRSGKYFEACEVLCEELDDVLADSKPRVQLKDILIALAAALVVGLIMYFSIKRSYRKKTNVKRVIDEEKQILVNYAVFDDTILSVSTTSHTIKESSSSGGGSDSGSHSGSSGDTFGGGGSSF